MVLHALVHSPSFADPWVYVEHMLSCVGWVRLSTESIVKITLLSSFNWEGKAVFICLVALAKEIVWWKDWRGWRHFPLWSVPNPIPNESLQDKLEKENKGRRGSVVFLPVGWMMDGSGEDGLSGQVYPEHKSAVRKRKENNGTCPKSQEYPCLFFYEESLRFLLPNKDYTLLSSFFFIILLVLFTCKTLPTTTTTTLFCFVFYNIFHSVNTRA